MMGCMANVFAVVANHSVETLQFLYSGWCLSGPYRLDFFWQRSDALLIDAKAKKV